MGAVFEVLLLLSPELPLSDVERFPPRCFATNALEFNRAYRGHIENRQAFEVRSYWDWNDVLDETDYLHAARRHSRRHAERKGRTMRRAGRRSSGSGN